MKVSIIVPIYNVEKYLDRCIQSLLHQTLQDIEIILVDDESPDNCPQLCDEYAKQNFRIKVVHKKNGGLGFACNSGLEIASGEYVAFCDSDDWVELNTYEEMYKSATAYKANAVYSGIQRVNDEGVVGTINQAEKYELYNSSERVQNFMMDMVASDVSSPKERRIQMSAKTVLYSMDIIKKHNIRFLSEREFMSEDLIFNLDFLRHASCVVNIPYTFYNYYDNSNSLTTKIRTDRFYGYKKLFFEMRRRYEDLSCNKELCQRFDRMLIGYIRHDTIVYFKANTTLADKKEYFNRIYKDSLWDSTWELYPIALMPLKHRLFAYAQRYRLFWLVFFISRL